MHATLPHLTRTDFPALRRGPLATLQVNLGYTCNQTCLHCHVNAGPNRTEQMTRETMLDVLRFVEAAGVPQLDLTGGAPEINPHFRELVERARDLGTHVIDRCNLTILREPGHEDLAEFLALHDVEVVASLPCYLEDNVDRQRGKGVFDTSIVALQRLNSLGYGRTSGALALNLVFNPQGPVLPPAQAQLEQDYRRHLGDCYGVTFDRLFVLTNMPIQRFGSTLISKGQFDDYLTLLKNAYQPQNLEHVMCRATLSVDWRGYVYDCDFNQMLDLPLGLGANARPHLREVVAAELSGNAITVKDHCYGCTAGQGSSCGGALA